MIQNIVQQNTSNIFAFALDLLWNFLALMFGYLPDGSPMPSGVLDSFLSIFSWLRSWSIIVPWDAPLGGVRLILITTAVVYGLIGAFLLVNMVLNRIWGHH